MKRVLDPDSVKTCGVHGEKAKTQLQEKYRLADLGYFVGRSYEV